MIWSVLIYGLAGGYFIFFLVIALGILRLPHSKDTSEQRHVTVLVACRNEEKDLPRCVDSLLAQDYPKELIEIILIDDQSQDGTSGIIERYAAKYPHIQHMSTWDAKSNHLQAKAKVIAHGAKKATGDWLFIVDADTSVGPKWLSNMLFNVREDDGLLGGPIMTDEDAYFSVSALEKVSLAYTQPITVGVSGWGLPAICSGPNMAIRKSVYDKFGGLEEVDFNIAEDLALIHIALSEGYKVKFHGSPHTVGYLISVPTLKHLFSQQRRWIRGGFEQGWELWAGLTFVFTYHFIYSCILLFGWLIAPLATATALIVKLLVDLMTLVVFKIRMKVPRLIRFWPLMFLYSTLAFIWLPLSLIFSGKIRWKGEGYEVKY